MSARIRSLVFALLLVALPLAAKAQFNLIESIPGQTDDEWGLSGQAVVEAPNGDVLVIYAKNGEITDSSTFPFQGLPATLVMHRKTRGLFWETPVVLDTAIENGVQSLGQPKLVLLPDGRLLLVYFYHNALFPNFSSSNRVRVSSDNGLTWQPLNDKERESADLSVTPSGTVVSLDWVEDEIGNLYFYSSVYDAESDSWSDRGFAVSWDSVCTRDLRAVSETEWHLYYSDCWFGYGSSNRIFRIVTTDGGASWSEAEEVFTADSGVGGTLGSIVPTTNGDLMAVYSSGTFMAYRTSSDGGATWSEAENWTGNTERFADISPKCSPGSAGPLCVFLGPRGSVNQLANIGIPGVSADPLVIGAEFALNAGFNDAWYQQATAGQGFLVTVFPAIRQMFVAWFTFDTERPPESVTAILGDPGHRWLTAQGTFEGNSADLTLYSTEGGVFDLPEPAPAADPAGVGRLFIRFIDCSTGLVSYEVTSLGISGEIPIQRIANDNVPLCEQLGGL